MADIKLELVGTKGCTGVICFMSVYIQGQQVIPLQCKRQIFSCFQDSMGNALDP